MFVLGSGYVSGILAWIWAVSGTCLVRRGGLASSRFRPSGPSQTRISGFCGRWIYYLERLIWFLGTLDLAWTLDTERGHQNAAGSRTRPPQTPVPAKWTSSSANVQPGGTTQSTAPFSISSTRKQSGDRRSMDPTTPNTWFLSRTRRR